MQNTVQVRKAPPLLPIFRSRSLARVLAYLFNHRHERPSVSELARRLGLANSTVNRDVAELETAGLIASGRLGKAKLVWANEDSPYYQDLAGLLQTAFGPEQVLAEQLQGVEGVEEAFIFGSWAARYLGQPGPQPEDIDVLIIADAPQEELDAIYAACRNAERLLNREVNPAVFRADEWAAADSGFLKTVRERPRVRLDLG